MDFNVKILYQYFLIGLVLVLVYYVDAEAPVSITRGLESQVGVAGGVTSFICEVTGDPKPEIVWFKNDKEASSQRYTEFPIRGGSVLRIEPLRTPRDDAEFTCRASNGVGDAVESSARLIVLQERSLPAGFPTITQDPDLKVVEKGRLALMECRADGNPEPDITWLKEYVPVDMTDERISQLEGGTLRIENAAESDQGKYQCIASNRAGTRYSAAANLFVRVRRVAPQFTIKPRDQEVMPGGSVSLTCVAAGSPLPYVKWMKEGLDLEDEDDLPLGRNVLELTNVQETANYTCIATSTLGTIETSVKVTVKALPRPPTIPQVSDISATSVRLHWNSGNVDPVLSYVVHYKLKFSSGSYTEISDITSTTYTVENLQPYSEYEFKVSAVNNIGQGDPSEGSTATTGELVPQTAPRDVQARPLSSSTILIQWLQPEIPNGQIRSYRVYYTRFPSQLVSSWDIHNVDTGHLTTISDLVTLTTYSIRVSALTAVGEGPLSPIVKVKTQQGVPSQPLDFRGEAISPTAIQLNWAAPSHAEDSITAYELYYNSSDGEINEHDTLTAVNTHQIRNLRANTLYKIRLAARTERGLGVSTSVISVRTRQAVPDAPPQNVRGEFLDSTSIQIHWAPPPASQQNGVITGYEIYYNMILDETYDEGSDASDALSRETIDAVHTIEVSSSARSSTLQDLEKWTQYRIWMVASTIVGDGPASEPIIVRTDEDVPDGAPKKIEVRALNSTAIHIKWRAPSASRRNGRIRGYQIFCQELSDNDEPIGQPKMVDVMSDEEVDYSARQERVIADLKPDTSYQVEISAYTIKGDGERSRPKLVHTQGAVPSKPLGFTVRQDGSSYYATWQRPTQTHGQVKGYKVMWGPKDRSAPMKKSETQSGEMEFQFTRLANGVDYIFKVSASNNVGYGEEATAEISTPETAPQGPPENVTAQALSPTAIKLRWDPPAFEQRGGTIVKYTVRYYERSSQNVRGKKVNDTNKNDMTVTQLQPNTEYVFQVQAYTSVGSGAFSREVEERTLSAPPADAPVFESGFALGPNTISLKWLAPTETRGHITGYTVYYTKDASQPIGRWQTVETGPQLETSVTGLEPLTTYTFKVSARSSEGHSPVSQNMQLQTTAVKPGSPQKLQATEVMENKMKLEWDPPRLLNNAVIKRYEVTFTPNQSGHRYSTEDTHIILAGLRPNTVYKFSVVAVTDPGEEKSDPTTITKATKLGAPPDMDKPSVVDNQDHDNTIPLRMVPGSNENGEIDFYLVVVVPCEVDSNGQPILTKSPDDYLNDLYINAADRRRRNVIVAMLRKTRDIDSDDSPAYIAMKVMADELQDNQENMLVIGDGRTVNGYLNKPLVKGQHYVFFVAACVVDENEEKFSTSQFSEPSKASKASAVISTTAAPKDGKIAYIIAPVIGAIVVVIIIVVIFLFVRRRRHAPTPKEKQEAPPHPSDPVEMRRMNFQTAAMMSHPPIPVSELSEHIERLKANDNLKFSQEYESIEPGQQFTWDHSNLDYNKPKNRYANVIAYDHSRVVLTPVDGQTGSDYTNANYCDGYRKQNAYIATQGPLPETIADFWRMVWDQRTATIVMMTKLEERNRVKCDQYWPSRGMETYGYIQVTLLDTTELATYTIRTFVISNLRNRSGEKREIRQLQFTAWPDHGVPEHPTPVLAFLRRVKACNPPDAGPIITHCSAGVGRTGAFIVIDSMLERIKHEKTVDIYGHVTCLRAQRNYMVQTEDQYIFIHDALLEAVQSGNTEVPARNLYAHIQKLTQPEQGETVTGMELEFKRLANTKAQPSRFVSANLPANKFKNRLVNIMPYESTRVCLQPIRGVDGSDYINASFIDGYRQRNAYIATQGPLAETTEDFWRMLWEHNSTIIVMLTKLREMGREKCHQYWPAERSARYQYFVVDPMSEYNMPQYILREFKVTDARDGQSRTIRQFQFTDWPEQGVPKSGEGFIDFIGQVHKTKEQFGQDGPITVHCSAGVGRTGVFISLSIVLERMRYEGVVDMYQTVKTLRTQRPAMVQTEDQYQFNYRAALEYLGSFDHYSN
ncbi:LOW QUALITY PROTEIN: receptor-type tyrosine-protein phosphatase delta-like [Ptychodera flava]|uniref:LOW QUALITY PROTEIN: receptor-type tyrosine-protein phosphatase delta-like n=1 Tax=Ptychodera flava TaxID=63121 RepID=UPI00396A3674